MSDKAPYSMECEMMVLGCMFLSARDKEIALGTLSSLDFYYPKHQEMFKAIEESSIGKVPASVVLTYEQLKGKKEAIPILQIVDIVQFAGSGADIFPYMQKVKEYAALRSFADAGYRWSNDIARGTKSLEVIEEARAYIDLARRSYTLASPEKGEETLILSRIEEKAAYYQTHHTTMPQAGVLTGLESLDRVLGTLESSHLSIVASRPSVGKTSFLLSIARNIATSKSVLFFSLEMTKEQMLTRFLSMQTKIPIFRIAHGKLTERELEEVKHAMARFKASSLHIYESGRISVEDLQQIALRASNEAAVDVLIIDYLQLISSSSKRESRQQEVAEVSRSLKLLSQDMKIPIITAAQLSRKSEERQDKRPIMSDLRESGSLEQDADSILLLHRRSYYDESDTSPDVELLVGKNRHGATGRVKLQYLREIGLFTS